MDKATWHHAQYTCPKGYSWHDMASYYFPFIIFLLLLEWWITGEMTTDWGKTKVLREKPAPVPFCPSQIPYGLPLD
jgi:hypothetical protein